MNRKIHVVSLGSCLTSKQVSLWRDIENRLFKEDPFYIPAINVYGQGMDSEFFVLYDGDEPVGRASVCADWEGIETGGERLGFIHDFILQPDYKEQACLLIERCLEVMKPKGADGVIVWSHGFPGLAAQTIENDVRPFSLPGNPPWYIDLLESNGFTKYKEWASYRLKLPTQIPEREVLRGKRCVDSLGCTLGPLNLRNREDIDGYFDLIELALQGHFGYSPNRIIGKDSSFLKQIGMILLCKAVRHNIHVIKNRESKVVGCCCFHPCFNVITRPMLSKSRVASTLALLKSPIAVRHIKRAHIGVIGFSPEMRGKGLVKLMDYWMQLAIDAGFRELDTGPMLTDNAVVIKIADHIQKKYDLPSQRMRFFTLLYRF